MPTTWPLVLLKEVVSPTDRSETPIVGKLYRQVGVRLWGEGAYERESMDGGQTRYTSLYRVEAGDLVVNKIWARNGSVAIVTPVLAGSYVSGEFPTFAPIRSRIDPRWLHWLTKTRAFWQQCDEKSRGTSGKNRIRPDQFLSIAIPLPPLSEQQRIVARIDALATRIGEAQRLRREAAVEIRGFSASFLRDAFDSRGIGRVVPLESACAEVIDNLHSNPVCADDGVPCVRSPDVGWGTLDLHNAFRTSEAEYRRRTVRGEPSPGDIVLVREGGGTGKAAVVTVGQRFSLGQRVMMLRPDRNVVIAEYMLYQMLSPWILDEQILAQCTGSASPHLNIGDLKRFRFVLHSLPEQRRIVAYLDGVQATVAALKQLQEETAQELAALLPSVLDRAFKGEL